MVLAMLVRRLIFCLYSKAIAVALIHLLTGIFVFDPLKHIYVCHCFRLFKVFQIFRHLKQVLCKAYSAKSNFWQPFEIGSLCFVPLDKNYPSGRDKDIWSVQETNKPSKTLCSWCDLLRDKLGCLANVLWHVSPQRILVRVHACRSFRGANSYFAV